MRHRSPSPNHAIVPGVVAITSCCHTCSKLLQSALKEKNERKHLLQSAFKEKNERKERKKGGRQLLLVTIKRKGNIVLSFSHLALNLMLQKRMPDSI